MLGLLALRASRQADNELHSLAAVQQTICILLDHLCQKPDEVCVVCTPVNMSAMLAALLKRCSRGFFGSCTFGNTAWTFMAGSGDWHL